MISSHIASNLSKFCEHLSCPRRGYSALNITEGLELQYCKSYVCYDRDEFEIKECVYLTPRGKIKESRAPFLKDSLQVLATLIKIKKEDGVKV